MTKVTEQHKLSSSPHRNSNWLQRMIMDIINNEYFPFFIDSDIHPQGLPKLNTNPTPGSFSLKMLIPASL